jgi:DNA (cytosine-5)-methyltransferase 3A
MNVLSLFDGISCGQLALKRLGIKVDKYYASEIEKSSIAITQKNFPNTIQLGDVTLLNEEKLKELPKIDLILAGSPCQGFSRQGNHLNFEHKESRLFFEFIRILEYIKTNNNKDVKFLLENVEMKKEWERTITEYVGVDCLKINSKLFSAQNRPRYYWSNLKVGDIVDKKVKLLDVINRDIDTSDFVEKDGLLLDSSFSEKEIELISKVDGEVRIKQATKKGYIVAQDGDGINLSFPTSKTRRGRVTSQISGTLDKSCNVCVYHDGIIRKLNIEELERLQTLPVGYTEVVSNIKRRNAIGNGWTVDVIAHILKELK